MPERHISEHLGQVLHLLDNLEQPGNEERTKEIAAIREKVQAYQLGIQRVDTKNMVMCILAGLEELTPRIDALVRPPARHMDAVGEALEQMGK